jgi:hypothetical protein
MTGRRHSGNRDQSVILIADDEALIRIVARIALENAERPGIKVLLMSGQMDSRLPSNVEFLRKPFGPSVLQDRMRALLASPASV